MCTKHFMHLISFAQKPYEVGSSITMFQVRKLIFRRLCKLPKATKPLSSRVRIQPMQAVIEACVLNHCIIRNTLILRVFH